MVLDNEELSSRETATAVSLNHNLERLQKGLGSTSFWSRRCTTLEDRCPDSLAGTC